MRRSLAGHVHHSSSGAAWLDQTTSAPLYAGRVRYASIVTLCVLATATAGCASASASGSGPKRSHIRGQGMPARDAPRRYISATKHDPPRQPSSTTGLAALDPERPRRADRALRHRHRRREDLPRSTHNGAGAAARQRARPLVDHASANASATSPDREMCLRSRRQTVNRPHRRQEGLAVIRSRFWGRLRDSPRR